MPNPPEATPDPALDLLRRWKEGDRDALDTLLADALPWLQREISRSLSNRPRGMQDSMDLAQTAVLNFLNWGPRFVPTTLAQFRALLRRIATNELIDQERRLSRSGRGCHLESLVNSQSPLSGFGPSPRSYSGPSRAAERSEESEWARLALQFLEPEERYLLLASEVEGLDWATIASELGMHSADAARVRCARLKPRLARVLLQLKRGWMPEES